MKQLLISVALVLSALLAQAQTQVTVKPQLKKGIVKTYNAKIETYQDGMSAITGDVTTVYEVADKTAEGYVVKFQSKEKDMNVNTDEKYDLTDINKLMTSLLNYSDFEYVLNANGQVVDIRNVEAIAEKINQTFAAALGENLPDSPEGNAMKENMQKILKENLSKENIIDKAVNMPGVLSLYGKTIKEGMEESGTFSEGLKTKTVYHIADGGKTIVATTRLDCTKEQLAAALRNMVLKLVPKEALEQANQDNSLDQTINNLIENGLMRFELNMVATYELGSDNWLKRLTLETDNTIATSSSKSRSVTTLVE